MATIRSSMKEIDAPERLLFNEKEAQTYTIGSVGAFVAKGAVNTKVEIYTSQKLPLETIIYGCWRREKTCAAWKASDSVRFAKAYSIVVDGKSTTPVFMDISSYGNSPVVLIGHKAGVSVTDADLNDLEGYTFFTRHSAQEGQFRNAMLIGDTLYAAHYRPDGKTSPMNGIYAAPFKKGKKLEKIIDRAAGPLFSFCSSPYFIYGPNVYRIDGRKNVSTFREPEGKTFTAVYANNDHIVLGTEKGLGYVVDRDGKAYSQVLIPYFFGEVTSIGIIHHQGSASVIAGSAEGDLVVHDFRLKERMPRQSRDFSRYDPLNPKIRSLRIPEEGGGNIYFSLSDIVMEVSMNDLLGAQSHQFPYRNKCWKGATSTIYSIGILQR